MLGLTWQERRVILFLMGMALIGLGMNFLLKVNSRIERVIRTDSNIAKININEASLEDLQDAKIITSKLAKRIIEYRNTHGPFRELPELKEIKGIGDYRYEKLKELFYVK